uniref:Uncharacterized protein n=1 Tax=Eucampia antarctica TaxID=49252 RepID=A0A7S2RTF0_9STRA
MTNSGRQEDSDQMEMETALRQYIFENDNDAYIQFWKQIRDSIHTVMTLYEEQQQDEDTKLSSQNDNKIITTNIGRIIPKILGFDYMLKTTTSSSSSTNNNKNNNNNHDNDNNDINDRIRTIEP